MSRIEGDQRDLEDERRGFKERGWDIRVYPAVPTSPPNPPDPNIQTSSLAKAEKAGDERRFQEDGPSPDAALAALLDVMSASLGTTDT